MSIDIPSWGAEEMMVKAKRKLFKRGWKQMANGRIDCIEKVFDEYVVQTVWAANRLLLNIHKVSSEVDQYGHRTDYVLYENPVFEKVKAELNSVFDAIVKRNKKKWDLEIKDYESRRRTERGSNGFVFKRNEKYGV